MAASAQTADLSLVAFIIETVKCCAINLERFDGNSALGELLRGWRAVVDCFPLIRLRLMLAPQTADNRGGEVPPAAASPAPPNIMIGGSTAERESGPWAKFPSAINRASLRAELVDRQLQGQRVLHHCPARGHRARDSYGIRSSGRARVLRPAAPAAASSATPATRHNPEKCEKHHCESSPSQPLRVEPLTRAAMAQP